MIGLKEFSITVLSIFILSVAVTAYITRTQFPQYVETEKVGKIDSTKWVSRAKYIKQSKLMDQLDEKFQESIKASDRKIVSLTKINGQLKIERDSLTERVDSLIEGSNSTVDSTSLNYDSQGISDTTITTKEVFSDGLFLVTSDIIIENNILFNHLYLEQLRKIDITIATATNDNNSEVYTYIKSQDFEELNIHNSTGLERDDDFPYFWVGVGTGVLSVAILNGVLLLN